MVDIIAKIVIFVQNNLQWLVKMIIAVILVAALAATVTWLWRKRKVKTLFLTLWRYAVKLTTQLTRALRAMKGKKNMLKAYRREIAVIIEIISVIAVIILFAISLIGGGLLQTVCLVAALGLAGGAFVWVTYEAAAPEREKSDDPANPLKKMPRRKDQPGIWTTRVPEREFKFVEMGGSLHKILHNLPDEGLDENDVVTDDPERMQPMYLNPIFELLRIHLKIYWVSMWYPLRNIFTFEIDKTRLIEESKLPKDHHISDLVEVESGVRVSSLREVFVRPLFLTKVTLNEKFEGVVVLMTEYKTKRPRTPIFTWKGKFFPLLDAGIEAALNTSCNAFSYDQLVNEKTDRGSDFEKGILDNVADSLEQVVGIRPTACFIVRLSMPDDAIEEQKALRSQEVERLRGLGVIAAAEAKATAIERMAIANATKFVAAFDALVAKNVDPNVAAFAVAKVLGLEAIASPDSKVITFAEGSAMPAGFSLPLTATPPSTAHTTTP